MSVAKPTPIEVSARDLSQQQLDYHLREFNASPLRGYILLLLSNEVKKEHGNLEDISEKDLKKLQGKISALKWLHSITEQNFQNQPKKHEKDN